MDEYYTCDVGSVWHKHWPEFIYKVPIFHGPVIWHYILKTIWWTNAIIGILDPCDAKIYHIKCMWISHLHFIVQWFFLISWRLLDGLILYWRYWFSVSLTPTNTCIYVVQWPIFFGTVILPYYFQYYLMNKPHSLDIGSDIFLWATDLYF